jgi:hypothetical protein
MNMWSVRLDAEFPPPNRPSIDLALLISNLKHLAELDILTAFFILSAFIVVCDYPLSKWPPRRRISLNVSVEHSNMFPPRPTNMNTSPNQVR